MEKVKNKSPEIPDGLLFWGVLTDKALGCLPLGRVWVYFTELGTLFTKCVGQSYTFKCIAPQVWT